MREVGFLLFSSLKAKIAWRKTGLFTISAETLMLANANCYFLNPQIAEFLFGYILDFYTECLL